MALADNLRWPRPFRAIKIPYHMGKGFWFSKNSGSGFLQTLVGSTAIFGLPDCILAFHEIQIGLVLEQCPEWTNCWGNTAGAPAVRVWERQGNRMD